MVGGGNALYRGMTRRGKDGLNRKRERFSTAPHGDTARGGRVRNVLRFGTSFIQLLLGALPWHEVTSAEPKRPKGTCGKWRELT